MATFDGRIPGRTTTWWALVFNRAMNAIAHIVPSLLVMAIAPKEWWSLPIRTAVYVATSVAINYLMAARAVSFANRTSFWMTLAQNVAGFSTLISTVILGLSGGILYLLVAPGLLPSRRYTDRRSIAYSLAQWRTDSNGSDPRSYRSFCAWCGSRIGGMVGHF